MRQKEGKTPDVKWYNGGYHNGGPPPRGSPLDEKSNSRSCYRATGRCFAIILSRQARQPFFFPHGTQTSTHGLKGILKHLGPGLIITATIVGSGELIATPALAAKVGFTMLWFIILGCLVKVFVQVELGRYTLVPARPRSRR